jgi:hypothetical protein
MLAEKFFALFRRDETVKMCDKCCLSLVVFVVSLGEFWEIQEKMKHINEEFSRIASRKKDFTSTID